MSIREHTSRNISGLAPTRLGSVSNFRIRQDTSGYVNTRQDTSGYVSILLEISQVLHRLAEVAEVDATVSSHCSTSAALLAALLALLAA